MIKCVRAFTLVELLVSIVLTGIISFFIYTMVTYSYVGFAKLYSNSKNFEDVKMVVSSLRKSLVCADKIEFNSQSLKCTRYDMYMGAYVKIEEVYKFLNGNRFEDSLYAKVIDFNAIPKSSYDTRGEFYKITYISDNISGTKIIAFNNRISSYIRKIYYYFDSGMNRLDMCVVYDDVVDGMLGQNESYVTKGQWLCFSIRN